MDRPTRYFIQPGFPRLTRLEPLPLPLWFKIMLVIALLASLCILALMGWALVELASALVGWLERN